MKVIVDMKGASNEDMLKLEKFLEDNLFDYDEVL
jgi:hypothetical protein